MRLATSQCGGSHSWHEAETGAGLLVSLQVAHSPFSHPSKPSSQLAWTSWTRATAGVLSRVSVVGQEFEQTAIEELSPPAVRPRVHGRLLELVAKQLLQTAASTLMTGESFQVRHLLLRDAAYEAVPKARRADLHERFAGWLEVAMGARAREYAEIIGYWLLSVGRGHLEQVLRVYIEHYNAHRPHRALGLQPPDPAVEPAPQELHERICAAYGLVERANGYLETSLLPGRRPPWTADSVKLVA